MTADLRIDTYAWAGGRETVLRTGPTAAPVVIVAMPLFEEANRLRAFAMALLRSLAARGIAGALPDLPATGESLLPTAAMTVSALHDAFACAVDHCRQDGASIAIGLRSGAFLDMTASVTARWQLAPVDGAALVREAMRTAIPLADMDRLAVAGNVVSRTLLAELATLVPIDAPLRRVVRLSSDPRPSDRNIDAAPLWRRAEPDNDLALAELLADDIADWIRACVG